MRSAKFMNDISVYLLDIDSLCVRKGFIYFIIINFVSIVVGNNCFRLYYYWF